MTQPEHASPDGSEFVMQKSDPISDDTPVADAKVRSEQGTHYLNYWKEMRDQWKDGDRKRATVANARFMRLPALRNGLRSGELAPKLDPKETRLSQAAEFVHLLGPENPLNGAEEDLVIAANTILAEVEADESLPPGKREFYTYMAASTLVAASRVAEKPADRNEHRKFARDLLTRVHDKLDADVPHLEGRDKIEVAKSGADAGILLHEIDYDELFEGYYNSAQYEDAPTTPEEFQEAYARLHMRHTREFLAQLGGRGSDRLIPSGVAFEWWVTLMHRHQRIIDSTPEELPQERMRTALIHEDMPHEPHGISDSLSDARDTTIVSFDEAGKETIIAPIQIKTFHDTDTLYRKPIIIMELRNKTIDSTKRVFGLMRITARGMIAEFEGDAAEAARVAPAMDQGRDIADWTRYPESKHETSGK